VIGPQIFRQNRSWPYRHDRQAANFILIRLRRPSRPRIIMVMLDDVAVFIGNLDFVVDLGLLI